MPTERKPVEPHKKRATIALFTLTVLSAIVRFSIPILFPDPSIQLISAIDSADRMMYMFGSGLVGFVTGQAV